MEKLFLYLNIISLFYYSGNIFYFKLQPIFYIEALTQVFIHVLNKPLTYLNEPRYEKTGFLHMRKQRHRSVTAQLISAFVFVILLVQFLYYLNPKFQASSHLLWLFSPVCVGPGRKPRRPVFSERGSNDLICNHYECKILFIS